METSQVLDAVARAGAALGQAALDWRVGQVDAPAWDVALGELAPVVRRTLDAAQRGDVPVPPAVAAVVARLLAHWELGPAVVEPLRGWATARALLEDEDGPQLPAAQAMHLALEDAQAERATTLWNAARVDLGALARGSLGEVTAAFSGRGPKPKDGVVDAAKAFLNRSRDVYQDALEHAQRRMAGITGGPSSLVVARTVDSPVLMETVPTAAARSVARALVAHMPNALPRLKRVLVKPRAMLPGVAALTGDGQPRVGWVERRGVVAMLELCELTLTAVLASAAPGRLGGTALLPATGHAMVLALLWPNVLRRVLQLAGADADRVRRHAAFVLLRRARMDAALAVAEPPTPQDALDALAMATARNPDVLEAAVLMGPWPGTLWEPAPLGCEHAARFSTWLDAGAGTLGMRSAWDVDAVVRPLAQKTVWDFVMEPGAHQTLGGVLGHVSKTPELELAALFEELLE